MKDWNDLQFLLSLARHGSLPAAAEALDVNRTTVSRRIENLEDALGVSLVERVGRDLVLTSAGHEAVSAAETIDGELGNLERQVYGRDQDLSGVIRVTLTEGIGCLIAPRLAEFQAQNPEVVLELSVSNVAEDLELMEADVAIRFTTNPPANLVGRCIGRPRVATYAANPVAERLAREKRVNYIQSNVFGDAPLPQRRQELLPVFRINSVAVIQEMIATGTGISELPCYIGEADDRLTRISRTRGKYLPDIWLLYHPRQRTKLRIRRFVDFIFEVFDELKPVLEASD